MKRAAFLAVLLWSSPALAAWEEVSDDDGCIVRQDFELGSSVMLMKLKDEDIMDDEVSLALFNDNWSIKDGDKLDFELKFEANDGAWLSNRPIAMDGGLAIVTELGHLGNLRNASGVIVYKGKERIEAFSWSLFFLGLDRLKSCITKARAPIVEQQRLEKLRKSLPLDPFAKAADANAAPAKP